VSLKVELKPGERLIVGKCLITNSDQRTRLFIDGQVPILREKDILTAETADTPAKRIYLAVQLMYLEDDIAAFKENYFELMQDMARAAPSATPFLDEISNEILTGSVYKALRVAKKLIAYEQDILAHAEPGGGGLSADGQADNSSARS